MESRTIFPVSCVVSSSPLLSNTTRPPSARAGSSPRPSWRLLGLITLAALVFLPTHLTAQQAYPASPYGYGNPYPNQYTQPNPQYGYSQPQYAQPQYQQPQYGYAQPQYSAPQQPYAQPPNPQQQSLAPQAAPPAQALSAQDLAQLLAPIALYPDALLAQILAASTYPAQVAVADQWLQNMRAQGYGSPDQIASGAQAQTSWDPSVKALTAFPDVIDMLNHNLIWTTNLGNAYYNQPQDVMQTVQVLRQRAEQAGNLQSTPQEDVTNDQGYIDLAPPNPQEVYVPTYNPWDVYGQPISPYPGFSLIGALGSFFGSSPIQYALSFAMSAFGHTPFGWLGWGLDWLANAVLFNHSDYYTHSASVADWGLPRGGPRAYYGHGGFGRSPGGYDRSYGVRQGDYRRGEWSNNRNSGEFNRAYQAPSNNYNRAAIPARQLYNRPEQQSYARVAPQQNYGYRPQAYPNHAQTYSSRPQTFSNPGYGYGYTNHSTNPYSGNAYSGQSYASRPNYAYTEPSRSYRAPQSYSSRAFGGQSYQGYGSSMGKVEHSGGFHLFGHSQAPKGFSGGGRESFGNSHAPKFGFGGGHSSRGFGGGHMSAPKMSHSGGGGGHGGGHKH